MCGHAGTSLHRTSPCASWLCVGPRAHSSDHTAADSLRSGWYGGNTKEPHAGTGGLRPRSGMRQTPSSTAAPSAAVIQCCIRGGDLNNVNASRRVLPHGIGQGFALPCRVGAGSNPAAATYRGATHARGPALDVLKQIIGSHCLWCRRSMSATQAVLKDALAEQSKAVAQGAIP